MCVNNLGLEKRLRIEVAECAALLHPNEVADLMRYVKARHPNINMESPSSMIRVWTCELALRRYVTFLALELPEIGNDDDDDVVTEGEIEDGEEEEETRPLIQGGQEEMLLVLRRAPPRKVVKSSESEDNDDCRQSQDPAMSLVHAEVERAEAEADALASEKVARSAVVVAVHAAQAACEGLNVNFIKSRAPSATTARTKSTKRKVPGQKLKVADSLLKRDRNHITSLLERSATIARMSNALYSGISTCGDLDVDVEHLDVHQDDKDTTNLDSDVASLEFCRWVVHASLRSKTQPIAQYTVEMSQQEAEQSLRGLVGVGNNRKSAIDSRAVAARDPAVFASEIGSRVWLCDLGRRRPWVPRLVLAPRVSLAREQLVRAPSDVAQHEICERESKDESQYSQTRAEGEARMSSLTKISAVFMKKDVNIPTDKDSILPCGDVVVCRHVQTNRWIFCVNHVSGDGGVYQLECTEARCLSLLANVSMSLTNEDADDSFGQSVAEILRALGAGSALCAMPSFSRPGTAGGDAADGREGVGLAPFITEEERRTGIARSDQGLEGVRERLAEIIVEKCLMLRTIDLTARPSFPSATGDDDVAESNLSGALQGAATAHARMALSVVPIVCAAATSMSQATQDDETEQSDLLASELSLSGDPDNVATHATESSFSISGMILAHSMARKLVARKRVVFYAPRIRIGRAHYSVKILRKEVQTEKDTSLYMANVGTVLLEIEVVDMRNRVWKLVENEDECLILVEDAILARMSEHISYSRSTPELTECHPNFKQLGRVADKGVVEESLLAPVLHAPRRASRRAYALIAQRLVFTKHQHRSHMTDDQRGRRKGSRLVLSLHRGSVTKMKEIAECVTADWLHEERHAWRGKLPKTRPVKEMVVMMSPEQRERVRAKERELYEKRLRAFQTETSALDYHLEYALEVTSHLGGETTMLQADGGEDQDEDLFGESSSAKMVEMQGWKWEDETATVAMRNLHSCEYSGREAQYVKFAAACPEHFFGVRRKPDVLGVPRFGAMVHGEHIGEYASEIDAAIAVDHFRLRLQPDLDKTQLNFSDAKVLPAPKNLLSDY